MENGHEWEVALAEARRIRREIDGLIAFLETRVPRTGVRGVVEFVNPFTGNKLVLKKENGKIESIRRVK
jgi:hypothetical protein